MRLGRKILPLAALGLLVSWIAAHAQQSGAPPRTRNSQVVLTDTEAFVLGPAEMIAGPEASISGMSTDGRYVLATRTAFKLPKTAFAPPGPPSGEISLLLWDSRTRRTQVVWKSTIGADRFATIKQVAWLPGTDTALADVTVQQESANLQARNRRALLLINAATGLARTIATLGEHDRVEVSPVQPAAALIEIEASASEPFWTARSTLRIVGASGNIGPVVRLPEGAFAAGYSPDGASLYLCAYVEPTRKGERATQNWYVLAIGTGVLTPIEKRPQITATSPEPLTAMVADALPVRVKSGTATLKQENTVLSVRPLWLESVVKSQTPRALLASDADSGLVLPGGQTALYQSQGALYAVPLLRMDKTAFLEARQKAQQAATISNAKQIGTALMMYVQDYDEVYPSANDAINNQVLPYIKNDAVFKNPATDGPGFVYTYAGGPLSAITDPAETLIGYVTGPGGRANIYADGHIVWKPN